MHEIKPTDSQGQAEARQNDLEWKYQSALTEPGWWGQVRFAEMSMIINVGFGSAGLYQNGERFIDCELMYCAGYPITVYHCDRIARKYPGDLWEIKVDSPFEDFVYRFVRSGKWILTEHGEGFA